MAMNDVYRTPAAALDSLVARSLQPCPEFLGAARRALGTLAAALRERGGRAGAQPWRVLKIAKVGASGRGGGSPRIGAILRGCWRLTTGFAEGEGCYQLFSFMSLTFKQHTCYAPAQFEVP